MILVTGAAGKTGHAVIRALKQTGKAVRALVFRPEYSAAVKSLGADSIIVGDMRDPAVYHKALLGVNGVYHICPNMSLQEHEIGLIGIGAALEARVDHFVYHSVLHPQIEAMPHHWQKLRVEEALISSGLNYTILQPGIYMQNIMGTWEKVLSDGVHRVPYSVDARFGMIDLDDLAQVAAKILGDSAYIGATYQLVGGDVLTPRTMAEILSDALGRTIAAKQISLDEWAKSVQGANFAPGQIDAFIAMFRYYDASGLWGNGNVLSWLLGRPPGTFREFIQRIVANSQ